MAMQSRFFSQVPQEDDLRGGGPDSTDDIDVPEVDLNPVPPAERPLPSKGLATLQGLNPLLLLLLIPVLIAGVLFARGQATNAKARPAAPAVAGDPAAAALTGFGTAPAKAAAAAASARTTAQPGATSAKRSAGANEASGAAAAKPAGPALVNAAANLRSGPGTSFRRTGSAALGQKVQVTGRNQTGDWLQLASGAWIAAFLVDNAPVVPVAPGAPTPPPPTPPRTT